MDLQVGVEAFLKRARGKFLLLKRSGKYPGIEGQWDVPGGRIEKGVSLIENLRREIEEETGLTTKGEPTLLAPQDIFINSEPKKHVVRLTYLASVEDGNPTLDSEHTDFTWADLDEIKKLSNLDPYVREIVENILAKKFHE